MSKQIRKMSATTVALAGLLTGCLAGPGFLKQEGSAGGEAAAIAAPVQQDTDGVLTAQVAAGSGVSQRVSASTSSAVAGSAVLFPPGSLAVSTSVTIQQGANIAAPTLASQLGLASGNSITPASNAVVITSTSRTDAATPFTIDLPLSSGAGLLDVASGNLIVVYTVIDATNNQNLAGIIPTSELIISATSIRFFTRHFGQFQAAYASEPVTADVSAPTSAPLLTEAAAVQLPTVAWQNITATYTVASGQLAVAASATGFTTLVSCVASVAPSGSTDIFFSGSIGTTLTGSAAMPVPTFGQYQVQLTCAETNGRLSASPWSAALAFGTPPAPAPAPSTTAVLPTALLVNTPPSPSNVTSLNVTVAGTNVAQYQYAITATSSCSGATYSAFMSISIPITSMLGSDGTKTLCVLGRDSSGNTQVAPTSVTWTLDTAPLTITAMTPSGPGASVNPASISATFSASLRTPSCNSIEVFAGPIPSGAGVPTTALPCATPVLPGIIPGTQTLPTSNVLSFTPPGPLALNAPYSVQLAPSLADLAGNLLAGATSWHFRTADGTWGTTAATGNLSNISSLSGAITASNQIGTTVAVYTGYAASTTHVYATILPNGSSTWSSPVQLDNNTDVPSSLAAAVDPMGNILVLWVQSDAFTPLDGYTLFSAYYNAGKNQWSYVAGGAGAPTVVDHVTYITGAAISNAAVAADGYGNFRAVWYRNDPTNSSVTIATALWSKSVWGSQVPASNSQSGLSSAPQRIMLNVNAKGDAFIVWGPPPTIGGLYSTVLPASGANSVTQYTNEANLNPTTIPALSASLDAAGNALLVWINANSSNTPRSNYLPAGSLTWGSVDLATGTSTTANLNMAMNQMGTARIAWSDATNGVQSRIFSNGVLQAGTQIVDSTASHTPQFPIQVAIDSMGNSNLAWQTSSSGTYAVSLPSGSLTNNPTNVIQLTSLTLNNVYLTMDPVGNAMAVGYLGSTGVTVYESRLLAGTTNWSPFGTSLAVTAASFTPIGGYNNPMSVTGNGQVNFLYGLTATAPAGSFNMLQFK